jgi:hypothetical protein
MESVKGKRRSGQAGWTKWRTGEEGRVDRYERRKGETIDERASDGVEMRTRR